MSDVEVVRQVYAAMANGDVEGLLELIDVTCVVTQDPRLPWGGRHAGHDGFATFALTLRDAIDSAVTTEAVFAADDEVLQYGRTRGTVRATGTAFDIPEVHRWTVRHGKVVAAHFAIDTPAMLQALAAKGADAGK
jgi:ketosteroid isomerase-like protein